MTKVVALDKGFYLKIREKGDVFDAPFSDESIAKCSWLAPHGTPVPADRIIPTRRNATMMQIIKGVDAESEPPVTETADTMSEMTHLQMQQQDAHPRAFGIPEESPEPVAPEAPAKRTRKVRSDKGVKRGRRGGVRKKTEEVAL